MRTFTSGGVGTLPVAALLVLLTASPTARAQGRTPTLWERVGTLHIDESSGVAVSRRFPGILWTHNDSGDEPQVYAIQEDGSTVTIYRILGARAVDWEDITLGPCPWDLAVTCLFLGDIGDNSEARTRVIVYIVPEPNPMTAGDTLRTIGPAHAVRIRYADRPHDAEGLAVDGQGNLSIVTKGRTGPILRYPIARADLLADSVVATPTDTLAIVPQRMLGRWVTGAAMRPDGSEAAVKTYTEIFFFRPEGARWVRSGESCFLGTREAQGEALDYLSGDTLLLTSERSNGEPAVHRVRC